MKVIVWLAVVGVIFTAAPAAAQSTTGTISGRVVDSQGLALPGVTVTATSPNLQGTRETVTSENGDYILTLLPSGPYRLVFDLAGFQRVERSVGLAPTQMLPLPDRVGRRRRDRSGAGGRPRRRRADADQPGRHQFPVRR